MVVDSNQLGSGGACSVSEDGNLVCKSLNGVGDDCVNSLCLEFGK